MTSSSERKLAKMPIMIAPAAATTRTPFWNPWTTAAVAPAPSANSSRIRETRKTS